MFDDYRSRGFLPVYLVVGVLLAMGVFVLASFAGIAFVTSLGDSAESARTAKAATAKLPLYWVVRPGETYTTIAAKTGLRVDDLRAFNPSVNPDEIVPGQRLKLRLHVPPPPPKPLGPRFWKVHSGQSFSSIAAKTGHSVTRLQELNPKLRPEKLKPGDRVRLRR